MTGADRPADGTSNDPRPDGPDTTADARPQGAAAQPAGPASQPSPPPYAAGQPGGTPPSQPSPPPYGTEQPPHPAGPQPATPWAPNPPPQQPGYGPPAGGQPTAPAGSGPQPGQAYPPGQSPTSHGQTPGGYPPAQQPPPYGAAPYGQQPGGGAPTGQQPAAPYPTGPHAAGGHGQQPGGYPAGPPTPGGYGPQPGGGYPAGPPTPGGYGPQPGGGYPAGPQAAGGYGPQPGGGYPTGQQPGGGYPTGAQAGPGGPYGAQPPAGYPSGQYGQVPAGPGLGGPYGGPDPRAGYQHPSWATGPVPGGQPDYLATGYGPAAGPVPPRRKRRGVLFAVIASATVVALTVGGVTAYTVLSGGGVTLDSALPGDSVAYAELNLDPPAAQKVAAFRFFRHFPDVKVRDDAPDLLEGLIEPMLDTQQAKQQYQKNVKPWVGKHAAFAADPQGQKAEAIVVVEATDTGKAKAGLDALRAQEHSEFGYVIKGKLVVLARSAAVAQAAVTGADSASLHDNDTFQRDVKSVGDDGVITLWADLAHLDRLTQIGLTRAAPDAPPVDVSKVRGRLVATLRFTDSTADLVMHTFGTGQSITGEAVGPRLASLPTGTVAAVALTGGDKLVQQAYQNLKDAGLGDQLTSIERQTGLSLPDDIAALVGTTTVVAVGGTSEEPHFGAITHTGDVGRARAAAEKLSGKLSGSNSVTVRTAGDNTVIADSAGYADELSRSGTLGNSDVFKSALPDLPTAQLAVYVDVQSTMRLGGGRSTAGPGAELKAVGMTISTQGDSATLHLRLVV